MRLDLLPVLHVILHFSEVNPLVVVYVHCDLFDGLVASEPILDNLDLLQAVGAVQAIEQLGIGVFSFQLQILESLLSEGETSLREASLAGLSLKKVGISNSPSFGRFYGAGRSQT